MNIVDQLVLDLAPTRPLLRESGESPAAGVSREDRSGC